jgi:leucine dehydrogenase
MSFQMNSEPYELAKAMLGAGQRRGWAVWDAKEACVKVSHAALDPLKEFLAEDKVDFLQHEGLFFEIGKRTDALMGAFVWKTTRGQACGGIRLRSYADIEEYVRDGMRLAIGMGRKSALAGLWAGGGKGVISQPPGDNHKDKAWRKSLMEDYGEFLTSLRGCYVAAEDAGLNVVDCDVVFSKTRFMTCISPGLGGSGNPSVPTAAGVVTAMEGAVDALGLGSSLKGLKVAIQGTGNVGFPLIKNLLDRDVASVVAADVTQERLDFVKASLVEQFGAEKAARVELRLSSLGDNSILAEPCDILAPCGFGSILNEVTIPTLQCKIVCGAANNQLKDPFRGDEAIAAKGITYIPDFLANRMGIVNCANEAYGRVGRLGDHKDDPAIARHLERDWANAVFPVTKAVIAKAKADGVTTGAAANALSDEYAAQPHPIWGHRSQAIIDSLLRDSWHTMPQA